LSDTLDLFAGPGGWGKHQGIEVDEDVVATRRSAGLPTIQADVFRIHPAALLSAVRGIVASAPCPPFSTGGPAAGRDDIELVLELMAQMAAGSEDSRRSFRDRMSDPRSVLSAEPLRWVLHHQPEWTAWEQVPGAMPLWEYAADVLGDAGYNVWVGLLDAANHGTAQNRKRAILMAHKTKLVSAPEPQAPVVMRDVLDTDLPDDAVLQMGRSRGTRRTLDQPAPTVMFGKSPSGVGWYRPDGSEIRPISLGEALVLQGFPADYPLQGGKVNRFRQVGDAVPRPLADAIISRLES